KFPALVTTSPIGTTPGDTGVLGLATTRTVFGGDVDDDFRSGGRITAGIWTDPHRQVSWEGSYLGFENHEENFSISSSAIPNLARPVFDTLLDGESALLIAHPTFLTGSIAIDASTDLQAFEVLRRQHLCSDGYINVALLLGYKHGSLDEMVRINHASTYTTAQGPILAGTTINGFDQFDTENNFNGFLIGLDRRHRW